MRSAVYLVILMSFFDKLRRKQPGELSVEKAAADDYAELNPQTENGAKMLVMIEKIDSYASSDRIIQKVKKGNIVIANMKELKDMNLDELKHSISKIRSATERLDGDIAGAGDEWIIITPSTVRVHRDQ